jgi:septin family protein
MASIILKIGDQMSYQDLNRLRTQIVKNLLKQGIPVFASWTEDPRQIDSVVSQTDMTTPNVSAAT